MSEEKKSDGTSTTEPGAKTPDPFDDVREGLGLLFRAAKSTIEKLPTKDLEKGVTDGVQEVGKAIGRVVEAISKEILPKTETTEEKASTPPAPTSDDDNNNKAAPSDTSPKDSP